MLSFKPSKEQWVQHLAEQADSYTQINGKYTMIGGTTLKSVKYDEFSIVVASYKQLSEAEKTNKPDRGGYFPSSKDLGGELAIRYRQKLVLYVEWQPYGSYRILQYVPGAWERRKLMTIDSLWSLRAWDERAAKARLRRAAKRSPNLDDPA
ncbi:hypothetical protein [Bosea sp. PAMC 26642]|uniref:hypothetical protein n=1 Tax=Bosea sp. (strain PAMC 26642) TaxID=1792307 RepID=UPI0007705A37|nr:hypothetical protein [Bosea sp. PAMC 26642]AMJ61592.1 hypothetical protein AXW83_15910 [Bosea sp. PAMC 26642]